MTSKIVPWTWKRKRLPLGKEEDRITALQRQINRVFGEFVSGASPLLPEFFSEPLAQLGEKWTTFSPNVSVYRDERAVVVTVELPGMDERDVEISLTTEALTIRGERKQSNDDRAPEGWEYVESSFGSFERIVPLMDEIEEDGVDATFSKGILTITLPKSGSSSALSKKVSIRSA